MTTHPQRSIWHWLISLLAIGFGLLTLREGGAVLFVDGAARQAAGHYVPFVLWFNFLAGFAYIVAGVGLWMRRRWAAWLAIVITVATALVFLAFGVHVALGGAWERRTVTQGEKFDPKADYVRRFVPELAELGDKFIHRPWDAPASELKQAGIVLGQNYPKPVVALDFGRRRALDAFAALRSE